MGANAFGQPIRRREDPRLLTGAGRFTADLVGPGMAHAFVVRSPHAHAVILGIDTSHARGMPGVLAVLTGADLEADGIGGIPAGSDLIRLPGTPADQGFCMRPSHPVLARDRVRFVGDSVALIVAETLAQAVDAADYFYVHYEPLPAVTGTARAGDPDTATVWEGPGGKNICFQWSAGDAEATDAAFARARRVVTLESVNNRIHVGSLENRGAIGSFEDNRFTLRTGTQMPHGLRDALADSVFHVPRPDVRVLVADVGGSFGIKNALYPEQVLVLWAARRLGRPVCWIGERADSFISDYQARDNVSDASLALDEEGRFLALRVRTTANIGAYLAPKGQLSPTSNTPALAGVYRLPHIHVSVTGVFTNTAPTEVYRGAGRPEATHLLERLVDEAARQTGIDRLDLRRRNLLTPPELPYRTALGLLYDSGDFPALMERALAGADLAGFPARRADAAARGRLRGFGLAQYCERVAGGWSEQAWLELDGDGRLTALLGTMSNGQGHETAFCQLLSATLGIEMDDIIVVQGDTDRIPSGHGTGGSASLGIGGAALAHASGNLVEQAKNLAAEALEVQSADVEFEDGLFRVAGTDRTAGWRDVATMLGRNGTPTELKADGRFDPTTPTFPNGCHIAEVEIDPETGMVTLASYTMVHDVGRVLNPMLLEGQLHGGVVQGVGQALQEQVVHCPHSSQVLTGSLMDYQLPRADELPELPLTTMATPSPFNPLGVKGCGEAGAAGAPPAVMNALMDALSPLGVRRLEMPATPFRVWQAILAARGSRRASFSPPAQT